MREPGVGNRRWLTTGPGLAATAALLGLLGYLIFLFSRGDSGVLKTTVADDPISDKDVRSVDLYVERVDVKQAAASDDEMSDPHPPASDTPSATTWFTAGRNDQHRAFDFLKLRGGLSESLGTRKDMAAGTYHSVRLSINTGLSSITLADGTVLRTKTGAKPGIDWGRGVNTNGILTFAVHNKGQPDVPAEINVCPDTPTTLTVHVDLRNAFSTVNGNARNGVEFNRKAVRGESDCRE